MYFAELAYTYSIFWLSWLALFLIIELTALLLSRSNKTITKYGGGTLSELIWRITRTNRFIGLVFAIFWAVLTYHFFIQK